MTVLASSAQVGYPHGGGLFMGMHWLWWLVSSLVLLALVWAFVRVALDRTEARSGRDSEEGPEDVLRRRFADGEIDEDEFERRMNVLRAERKNR